MTDKYDAKAREIIDRWYDRVEYEEHVKSGTLAEAISSALRSAAAEEREAILKSLKTVEPPEEKLATPEETYGAGDVWEAYFLGANALRRAIATAIRSRGDGNLVQSDDVPAEGQCDHLMKENAAQRSLIQELEKALYRVAFGERDGDGRLIRNYSADECKEIAALVVGGDHVQPA